MVTLTIKGGLVVEQMLMKFISSTSLKYSLSPTPVCKISSPVLTLRRYWDFACAHSTFVFVREFWHMRIDLLIACKQ